VRVWHAHIIKQTGNSPLTIHTLSSNALAIMDLLKVDKRINSAICNLSRGIVAKKENDPIAEGILDLWLIKWREEHSNISCV